jgi:hypothetical protein
MCLFPWWPRRSSQSSPDSANHKRDDPLSPFADVIRVIKGSMDGRALPTDFELSTKDKESSLRSITVWCAAQTTPIQARSFLGTSANQYELYATLNVGRVCGIQPSPLPEQAIEPLSVVWDPLEDKHSSLPDSPGAFGHAGVKGLMREPGLPKLIYLSLRSQLADLANENLIRY